MTTNVTGASLKEIFFEIDELRKEAPSAAELRGIQNNLAGIFVVQNASRPASSAGSRLSIPTASVTDYLSSYVKRVMAVTPEMFAAWPTTTSPPTRWRWSSSATKRR